MKCPSCGYADSRVIDSRPVSDGTSIRRRRECLSCQKRFNTFEVVEALQIVVVKKDGSKELFDRNKLLTGLLKACQKRPVNAEEIVSEVEAELQNSLKLEVTSREIGELVMSKLKARDEVAYVRFASVYREFRDLDTFLRELNELKKKAEVTAGPAARKQKK
ncbi:MAG TPA: transcriptional repressor NrdR [Clostridiales bacterium]|jgi:transcriptional repressor NrdR|nr:transcriptional repressor NrdR [Clostridiales bacterium]